ncbi:MAG: phosphoglycerate dehydrogenase [Chloroflexi bacterium]|nr:phosphoglycerate dehydrogenase [Chloroflexota bacterium]
MRPRVLVTDPVAQDGLDLLGRHAQVDVKLGLPPAEIRACIGEYSALMVRSETRVTADIIEAGSKLQVIARAGVGVDNIDVEAATRHGIVVVNAPLANTISAAEHAMGLMLALARNIPQAHSRLQQGEWDRRSFLGVELRGKVLGLVGLGKVGTAVAKRAQAFDMRVLAYDPFVSVEAARALGVELVPLEELLRRADFASVHTPLTPATRGLLGAKELAMMKPSARLVNTARGGIVDEEALLQALKEGRLAGAALDVFVSEPLPDPARLQHPRLVVTPHLAASTVEAQASVAVDVAEEVIAVLEDRPPRYAVNVPYMPPDVASVVQPYIPVAILVGHLVSQLSEGQWASLHIKYEGDIGSYDCAVLKAALLQGLLEPVTGEERVNLVNAQQVAARRGLRIVEHKDTLCRDYGNLVTGELTTSAGVTSAASTLMRGRPHIVRVNDYWLDLLPEDAYMLFCDHRDRPGLIGAVGNITGVADINISSMHVSRVQPRGQALMVLGLDEALGPDQLQAILSIPDVYTAKLVKL